MPEPVLHAPRPFRRPYHRVNFGRFFAAALLGLTACLPCLSQAAGHPFQVLIDEPGRLVGEIDAGELRLLPSGSDGALRAECEGCSRGVTPGEPDLPYAAFDVLCGPAAPRTEVTPVLTGFSALPGGIAPVPVHLAPGRDTFARNDSAYRAAAAPTAVIGPALRRGAWTLRSIRVPIARWDEARHTLTWMKQARITVKYPVRGGAYGASALPAALRGETLNPVGGAAFASPARPHPSRALSKGAASQPLLGDSLLRIRVGDGDPGAFAEDRVYGLAFADIARLAPSVVGARIEALRMYTGPGDTLPIVPQGEPVPGRLRQIPLGVTDANGNGTFDGGDSVSFYGHGTSVWRRLREATGPIRYAFNEDPYDQANGYWLDFSGKDSDAPMRLTVSASPPGGATSASLRHYVRAERDLVMLSCEPGNDGGREDSASGVSWFWIWGGSCRGSEKPRTLSGSQLSMPETDVLKDALQGGGDSVFVGMFPYPYQSPDDFTIRLEGGTDPLPWVESGTGKGNWYVSTAPLGTGGRFRFASVEWRVHDAKFEGYTVSYRRRLAWSGTPLRIFPEIHGERARYRVEGGAGLACLRIEDGVAVKRFLLDGAGEFSDSLAADADAQYLLYDVPSALPASALSLEQPGRAGLGIRDLAGGSAAAPEYLIIAPGEFAEQAAAWAKYRQDPARGRPYKTAVVFTEDIYRAYSGGRLSPPAIRDFLRWAWSAWGGDAAGSNPLRYVLLLGDGHYDYREVRSGLRRDSPRNRVPPFEWLDGRSNGAEGLASDDYYALLDSGETVGTGALLDVAVGRLPVNSSAQAEACLAKAKAWEDPALAGAWRGRITFAADDGVQRGANARDDDLIKQGHTTSSDSVARRMEAGEPGLAADKIYLVDYPMNPAYHKPEASQDLLSLIDQGTVLVNYVGHGSHNQWADEVLLQSNDGLARMHNPDRTPMINSFSCTVGRFDDYAQVGMSELFVAAPERGAIAAVSAVRESFPSENIALAHAFYSHAGRSRLGDAVPMGEALRLAKNDAGVRGDSRHNSSRYALLGEPVLALRKAPLAVSLDKTPDSLQALDCGNIEGRIEGGSGSGSINIRILAQPRPRFWPPVFEKSNVDTQRAVLRGPVMFEGTFPYKDGRFSAAYFIPKQIAFGDTNARILAFAWDAKQEREGSAAKTGLAIRGVSRGECAKDSDGKGPRIRITGCEPTETGNLDFPDQVRLPIPYCLEISVEDSLGGVLAAEGPDEGTTLEIPGVRDPFHPHAGIDGLYRKVYRLPLDKGSIPPGIRLLKVSARDGYGNFSSRTLRMDLNADSSLNTISAYNVPNPMKRNGTTFYFSTVAPARAADLDDPTSAKARIGFEVRVFDQAGRLVRVFDGARSGETRWDGRDAWGNGLGNGVYFYQVIARQAPTAGNADSPSRTLSSKRNILVLSR